MRARTAVLLLAALALFSLLFSLAAENGLWPRLPAGALHDTDLWVGFAAGAVLLILLLRGGAPPKRSEDASTAGTKENRDAVDTMNVPTPSADAPVPPTDAGTGMEDGIHHAEGYSG